MRHFTVMLITCAAVLVFGGRFATANDWDHEAFHDQLGHNSFHRELDHSQAHRYPMNWWQHNQLHNDLNNDAISDHIDHDVYHGNSWGGCNNSYNRYNYGGNPYGFGGYQYAPSPGFGVSGRNFSFWIH